MAESYTKTTYQSWGDRIKDSFRGAIVGLILFVGAFPVLFWNEGRAVLRTQTLEEGEKVVLSIEADEIEWLYDEKLVHLTGKTATDETLSDERFSVVIKNAVKLRRVVEMYQWQEESHTETREQLGGGSETITTYTYSKQWLSTLEDSNHFRQPEGHQNPAYLPVKGKTVVAKKVKLGLFALSKTMLEKMSNYQQLPITPEIFAKMQEKGGTLLDGKKIQLSQASYYIGDDPRSPKIGDLRIKFEWVKPEVISVIAKQMGSKLMPYKTKAGGVIELFEYGEVTAQEMFEHAKMENIIITWFLRIVGFIMMFIGLNLLFEVLRMLAAVVPTIGNIVGILGGILAFLVALVFSLITIAVAWLFYRPLLGLTILAIAGSMFALILYFSKPKSVKLQQSSVPTNTKRQQKEGSLFSEIDVPIK
jgi:hypothetical protein